MDNNDITQIKKLAERAVKDNLPLPPETRGGFENAIAVGIEEIADQLDQTILNSQDYWDAQTYAIYHNTSTENARGELLFYFAWAVNKSLPPNPLDIFYTNGSDAKGKPLTAGLE